MTAQTKKLIKSLSPQLIVISVVLLLQILSWVSLLPSPAELSRLLVDLLSRHGLPFIVIASFLENLAGVGTYFPGSVALIAAMTLTAGDPMRALVTYVAIVLPAIAANIASFMIGYFTGGRGPQNAPRSASAIAVWYAATYWHPQLAAITAMASGAEGVSFFRYLAFFLPISLTWTIAWALLLYNIGLVVDARNFLSPLLYVYLIGWLLWDLWKQTHQSNT